MIQANMKSVTFTIFEKEHPILMRNLQVTSHLKEWDHKTEHMTGLYFTFSLKEGTKEDALLLFEDNLLEVEKLLGFYKFSVSQGEQQIHKIAVTGDHPFIKEFTEKIAKQTELPIVPLTKEHIFSAKNELVPEKFKTLLGLSLKEVQ
ncbi:hypothetical protein [Metabacillus sp. RGM 3146]|uniref:hypothetical protein n=1 Tax=Metabacillus sp. RGM 3146 TaxID=3401092 RepID=UPI003B991317